MRGVPRKIRLLGYYANYISGDFLLNARDEIAWINPEDFAKFDFAEADLPIIESVLNSNVWK